jgi:hypothetical protein
VSSLPPQSPPGRRKYEASDEPGAEKWRWSLMLTQHEAAVELWRDDDLRIIVPLTADQAELLMGKPVSMSEVLKDGL